VTDSLPSALASAGERVEVVPVGPLIGEAIGRLDTGEPLGDLTGLED
jgi:hypothetical protein